MAIPSSAIRNMSGLMRELGFVSPERANTDYGVIVDLRGNLDEKATDQET